MKRIFLASSIFLALLAGARATQVVFAEAMYRPVAGKPEFIEVWNITRTPLDMGRWRVTNGVDYTFPDFTSGQAHILQPFERILISAANDAATRAAYPFIPSNVRILGPWTGFLDNAGERVTLTDKNGVILCTLRYDDHLPWPLAADGTGHSIVLINENTDLENPRNWRQSYLRHGSPGKVDTPQPQLYTDTTVVPLASSWKYYDGVDAPAADWNQTTFDEAGWSGPSPALFGFEPAPLPSPGLLTPTATGRFTYYFRTTFVWNGSTTGMQAVVDQVLDDGAIYYLNGQQIGYSRMKDPALFPPTHTSGASLGVGDATLETDAVVANAPLLVSGTNYLAAEAHQISAGSNDMVFGAQLKIRQTLADTLTPALGARLSEAHFSAVSRIDWIEVFNNGTTTIDASGLWITSARDALDKVQLSGTIAAGAYASFNVDFAANNDGEITLYLIEGSNNVVSTIEFTRAPGRDSWQRFPVSGDEWYASSTDTRGVANNPAGLNTSVVINEIMADPPSNQPGQEYIELYNRGATTVNLGGWRLEEAVEFAFPTGTTLAPGAFLVIAANPATINSIYGISALGGWQGGLNNSGETVRLVDASGSLADAVDYRFGGAWPDLAHGNGSSLELIHPDADNSAGGAWKDSNENAKSSFQAFSINGGTYSRTSQGGQIDDELRLWLVGDSHVVLRNIVLRPTAGGGNLLVNAGGVTLNNENVSGWQARGTHWSTFSDAEGVHILADGHGDNKANHAEKDAAGMAAGTGYTLEFEARWVSGRPRLVAQTWDTTWGGTALIPIPGNLGTPGAANSRLLASPPPQIGYALHSPVIPLPGSPVTITARVTSAAALTSVAVWHRADDINNTNPWTATAMNDAGTGGDATVGDGIYTAQISAYTANKQIAQFYVRATASNGQTADYPKKGAAEPGLWIVDNQPVANDLRRMRVVVSAYWLDALNQNSATGGHTVKFNYKFPRHSNHFVPCTFIGNETDIYYGSSVRKTGSPFTRQTDANLVRGKVSVPTDNLFRGQERLYWDSDSGTNLHHNRIIRYWLYLLGVPGNENEFCYVMRNGDTPVVRENSEAFTKEMVDRLFERGSDGEWFEMDDTHYIADDGATRTNSVDGSWTYKNSTNPTLYCNSFTPKTREYEFDYASFIEWTRQLGASPTQPQLDAMADTQMMAAYAAVRGYAGDWDNMTIRRGKNGYMYRRPTDGKWMMLQWDSDLAFLNTSEAVLASAGGNFDKVFLYYSKPIVRRYMNYYLTEMLSKYTTQSGGRINEWLTAEENASPGFTVATGTYTTWFSGRQAAIQAFIGGAYTTPFALTSPPSSTSAATVNFNGTAPSSATSPAYRVEVLNHPEAVFAWVNETSWTLTGIVLTSGANALTFRMYDRNGAQVGANLNHTITKTGNAPPAIVFAANPSSLNVALGQTLTLNASGSVDPEGGALTFAWTFAPATGVTVSNPSTPVCTAVFSTPGTYTVSVQATDPAAQSATLTRKITVFNAPDFQSFGDPFLPAALTAENIEVRDNYSPTAWYSLDENPGALLVQVLDDSAKPLGNPTYTHPFIWRALPAAGDWALQTEVTPSGPQLGSFGAGLMITTTESSQAVRYSFAVENGTSLVVRRAQGSGSYSQLASVAITPGSTVMRVERVGPQLVFQYRLAWVWTTVRTQSLPVGATAHRGGVAVFTTAAQTVEVMFDYLLLSDPASSSNLIDYLRISEIMYNPATGGVEFIEFTNIGPVAIQLQNVHFDPGKPVNFNFPAYILQPGACIVVVANIAAFQSLYGTSAAIAGQWPSDQALSNGGERITVLDPDNNIIQNFTYGDGTAPGWPTTPDGGGTSLVVISRTGNYNDPANWHASNEIGGSPGYHFDPSTDTDNDGMPDWWEYANGLSITTDDALLDKDRDGANNLLEFALDMDPGVSDLQHLPSMDIEGGYATLTIDRNVDASALVFTPQRSLDLNAWQSGGDYFTVLVNTPSQLKVRLNETVAELSTCFLRLQVTKE